MDEKRQSLRASGIPRLSRLPLPSKIPTLRPSPSRDSLTATGDLPNPKLRPAPSRDRLSTTATPGAKDQGGSKNLAQPSPRSRVVSAQTPKTPRLSERPRIGAAGGATSRQAPGDVPPGRSLGLARRASQQFAPTASSTQEDPYLADAGTDAGELIDGGAASLDTIRARSLKTRPSLSERTIETLSQLPSSPALTGKSSSFFDPDGNARRPPSRPSSRGSRPGSSYQSDGSNRASSRPRSRPGSSSGPDDSSYNAFRASTNTFKAPLTPIDGTPTRGRASASKTLRSPLTRTSAATLRATPSKTGMSLVAPIPRSRTPSPEKRSFEDSSATVRYGAKTIAARPSRSRPSLNGLFKKPSIASMDKASAPPAARKTSLASHASSTSYEETNPSNASTTSTVLTADSAESSAVSTSRKSSAALREQIAKAKAAKRAASRQVSVSEPPITDDPEVSLVPTDTSFDFGLASDPFGQRRDGQAQAKVIQSRVQAARTSGRLNIAAMSLREIPTEVLNMYDLESIGKPDGSWAESVDLTRFVAADNELEMIEDAIFPDKDPEELANDEDGKGSIFGGLETLDLHGNMLISLPLGLRRLQLLTSLNLSQNRITNNALEVISQISSLRDLKLGGNLFYGPLDPCFSRLENLEIADLHGNNISALPLDLEKMSKLRILNISENNFESLLFEPLSKVPLTELIVRKNKLSGVLIEDAVQSLPSLQVLDVSSNQITHLVTTTRTDEFDLPSLHQLCVSMNRLQELPSLGSWENLVTLSADENSINSIPEGFTSLAKLRHVDFSSNDIRIIPPEIARMENLAMLRLSGNPLRDKKFCSATTDELKEALASRLEPIAEPPASESAGSAWPADGKPTTSATAPTQEDNPALPTSHEDNNSDSRSDDDFATPPTSAPHSPARSRSHTASNSTWPVKPGGILDRSETESSSLHPVICSRVAAEHTVREIYLQRNLFTAFPDSLSFFADSLSTLSLSHNQLVGESYLGTNEELVLTSLKELNLASNHITGLAPLVSCLRAPALQKLDVSFNRVAGLPSGSQLKDAFPNLTVLLVSNNHLVDLDPDSIKGIRVVDAMNNDIEHLNPRIGLLGGSGGLERLEVTGNRFRVPRFNVIERGTEATLRWLRGRVPVAEMGAWREANQRGELDDVD